MSMQITDISNLVDIYISDTGEVYKANNSDHLIFDPVTKIPTNANIVQAETITYNGVVYIDLNGDGTIDINATDDLILMNDVLDKIKEENKNNIIDYTTTSAIELTIGNTLNNNSGFRKDINIGSIIPNIIDIKEITYIGSLGDSLIISCTDKIYNKDVIYVKLGFINGIIPMTWNVLGNKYQANIDNFQYIIHELRGMPEYLVIHTM